MDCNVYNKFKLQVVYNILPIIYLRMPKVYCRRAVMKNHEIGRVM